MMFITRLIALHLLAVLQMVLRLVRTRFPNTNAVHPPIGTARVCPEARQHRNQVGYPSHQAKQCELAYTVVLSQAQ